MPPADLATCTARPASTGAPGWRRGLRVPPSATLPLLLAVAIAGPSCREPKAAPLDLQLLLDGAQAGDTVRIPAGRFSGGLVLKKPLTLVGAGAEATVLEQSEGVALQVDAGPVVLEALGIEGGEGALVAAPEARLVLRRVRLEARGAALTAEAGAQLQLEDTRLSCVRPTPGSAALVATGAQVQAKGLVVQGACGCGVLLRGARARLEDSTLEGASDAALRALDSQVRLTSVRAQLGAGSSDGAVIFAARSQLSAVALTLSGGEQGMLVRGGSTRIDGLEVAGVRATGVGLVGGTAQLSGVHLVGPFTHAALLAGDQTDAQLRALRIERAGASGVLAVRAHVVLREGHIAGAESDADGDFGHGLVFETSDAQLDGVVVQGAEGAALYAAASQVQAAGLVARQVALGVAATHGSRVQTSGLRIEQPAEVGALAWGKSRIGLGGAHVAARLGGAACSGSQLERDEATKISGERGEASCSDAEIESNWRAILSR